MQSGREGGQELLECLFPLDERPRRSHKVPMNILPGYYDQLDIFPISTVSEGMRGS